MHVYGDDARRWRAVYLATLESISKVNVIIEADDATGYIKFQDGTGEESNVILGSNIFKLVRKLRYEP